MSLPTFPEKDTSPCRAEVINQILSSIAMEELGLSHIINAEGEKLQYVLGTIPGLNGPGATIEDLLKVNESIRAVLQSTAENQTLLRSKLQNALSSGVLTGPTGPAGARGPFLSSYIEALGSTQTIADNSGVVFVTADNVGNNIEFTPPGTTFTVHKKGLYLVEWSINLASNNTSKADFYLLQNGVPTSVAANSAVIGNFSSGALMNITDVPYTIGLRNYSGADIVLEDYMKTHSAASIRITRFADGPSK